MTKGQAAVSVMGIEERRKRGDSEVRKYLIILDFGWMFTGQGTPANAGYAGPK